MSYQILNVSNVLGLRHSKTSKTLTPCHQLSKSIWKLKGGSRNDGCSVLGRPRKRGSPAKRRAVPQTLQSLTPLTVWRLFFLWWVFFLCLPTTSAFLTFFHQLSSCSIMLRQTQGHQNDILFSRTLKQCKNLYSWRETDMVWTLWFTDSSWLRYEQARDWFNCWEDQNLKLLTWHLLNPLCQILQIMK